MASTSSELSNYKNNNTFKVLVGISPSGAITFVSDLYSVTISDKRLTQSEWNT